MSVCEKLSAQEHEIFRTLSHYSKRKGLHLNDPLIPLTKTRTKFEAWLYVESLKFAGALVFDLEGPGVTLLEVCSCSLDLGAEGAKVKAPSSLRSEAKEPKPRSNTKNQVPKNKDGSTRRGTIDPNPELNFGKSSEPKPLDKWKGSDYAKYFGDQLFATVPGAIVNYQALAAGINRIRKAGLDNKTVYEMVNLFLKNQGRYNRNKIPAWQAFLADRERLASDAQKQIMNDQESRRGIEGAWGWGKPATPRGPVGGYEYK